ncbi:hypothetical protein C2E23DRAFT_376179 [Lenzites betulinus]|nr:hypothetical protein C2E23DRAFT_376179 [Lenzites betulinus]
MPSESTLASCSSDHAQYARPYLAVTSRVPGMGRAISSVRRDLGGTPWKHKSASERTRRLRTGCEHAAAPRAGRERLRVPISDSPSIHFAHLSPSAFRRTYRVRTGAAIIFLAPMASTLAALLWYVQGARVSSSGVGRPYLRSRCMFLPGGNETDRRRRTIVAWMAL